MQHVTDSNVVRKIVRIYDSHKAVITWYFILKSRRYGLLQLIIDIEQISWDFLMREVSQMNWDRFFSYLVHIGLIKPNEYSKSLYFDELILSIIYDFDICIQIVCQQERFFVVAN